MLWSLYLGDTQDPVGHNPAQRAGSCPCFLQGAGLRWSLQGPSDLGDSDFFFFSDCMKMVHIIRWNIRCMAFKTGNKFFKQKWYFALWRTCIPERAEFFVGLWFWVVLFFWGSHCVMLAEHHWVKALADGNTAVRERGQEEKWRSCTPVCCVNHCLAKQINFLCSEKPPFREMRIWIR